MSKVTPPRLLTIAGSDSGGGAGIQADLKTFFALGCHGMSAITALTAQNTVTVDAIYPLPAAFVKQQLTTVVEDIGLDALKIGMLHSVPIIEAVSEFLQTHTSTASLSSSFSPSLTSCFTPCVLDPVMVAKSGSCLLESRAVQSMRELLFPYVTVLTPNLPEAEILLGHKISTRSEMQSAAEELLQEVSHVVIKGGHLEGEFSPDYFASRAGQRAWLIYPRVVTRNTHGTGCTFSAAIAAFLGKGKSPDQATREARAYLQAAMVSGAKLKIGDGCGPVDHAANQGGIGNVL